MGICGGRKPKPEIGNRYGRWVVTGEAGNDRRSQRMLAVVCACGTKRVVAAPLLRNGRSRSCGCLARDRYKTLIGKRFGRRVVIGDAGRDSHGRRLLLVLCDCGRTATLNASNIRGSRSSCRKCLQKKTHCKWGHSLDDAYVYELKRGTGTRRVCRQCVKRHH